MQPEGKERNGMEHRFGIFDTVDELNRAAAAQKAEGDEEALFALAAENGICREDVEGYLDDAAEELATPLMAWRPSGSWTWKGRNWGWRAS